MRRVVVFGVLMPMMTLMVVACGEDGPTTLAEGDVEFVGSEGLGGQSLNITAEEEDGEVTGEARFNEVVITFECADTDTDGSVILGGEVTSPSGDNSPAVGEMMAVFIREGDPDSVALWNEEEETEGSCSEILESIPEETFDDNGFVDVEGDGDIETG